MYELGWIQDFIDGGSIYGPSKGVPVGGGGGLREQPRSEVFQ